MTKAERIEKQMVRIEDQISKWNNQLFRLRERIASYVELHLKLENELVDALKEAADGEAT